MSRIPQQPRNADTPTEGWYRCRLVKGGPLVPCWIMHIDGFWVLLIDGEASRAEREPWHIPRMEWVNMSEQISPQEYERMRANPAANPTQPVDFRALKTLMKGDDDGIA